MKYIVFILTLLTFCTYSHSSDSISELEKEIVRELNKARTSPRIYANYLADFKRLYDGDYIIINGRTRIRTNEGVSAVEEAISFLERVRPVPALKISRGLSMAADSHVKDQGPTGYTGHQGTDGSSSTDRMNRFGKWGITAGENISYGFKKARQIVMQLIIDDGVRNRGHRRNIFKRGYKLVGIGCGQHSRYGWMCVMDFAGSYNENN